jgi:hypothetical protein
MACSGTLLVCPGGGDWRQSGNGLHEGLDLALHEPGAALCTPGDPFGRATAKDGTSDLPHMLLCVSHIDDLYRARKMLLHQPPQPPRAITQHHDLPGAAQAALHG